MRLEAAFALIATTIQKLKHPQRDLFDGYGQSNFRQYVR